MTMNQTTQFHAEPSGMSSVCIKVHKMNKISVFDVFVLREAFTNELVNFSVHIKLIMQSVESTLNTKVSFQRKCNNRKARLNLKKFEILMRNQHIIRQHNA